MATMIQQAPLQGLQRQEMSAWQQLMQKFPTFALVLQAIGDLLGYFTNGQFLVDAWRWAVLTAGNISEACLMFAALYVTAASVEPDVINSLPYGLPGMLSAASMFSLTLLPEIIVYHAIAVCYQYWHDTFSDRAHRGAHCTWAVLYSLPTLAFLAMTIYTLCSFVSIGHTFAAPSWVLTARVLSGWSYGLVSLIKAAINRKSPVKTESAAAFSMAAMAPASVAQPTLTYAQHVEVKTEAEAEQIAELKSNADQGDSLPSTLPLDEPTTDPEIETVMEPERQSNGTAPTVEGSVLTSAPVPSISIATRRKPLTIAEVSEVLNCSERYVRTLRTQGKLAKDEKDDNLTTAQSCRAFLKTKAPLQG
jgi:hypothetical protein